MIRVEPEQNECDVGADFGVQRVILLVAKLVPELWDDVRVWQELVPAEQVVQVVDVVGKLRQLEQRVGGVGHEDGRRKKKSGLHLGVVFWQLRQQDLKNMCRCYEASTIPFYKFNKAYLF